MLDEKVYDDLVSAENAARGVEDVLSRLYYHSYFGTAHTRPIISMMIAGARYLADNIAVLRNRYAEKVSK